MDSLAKTFRAFWQSPWSLVGIVACMALVAFISPSKTLDEPTSLPAPHREASAERTAFVSKPTMEPRTTSREAVKKDEIVMRQLDRHVRMRAAGYYESILGNPNTHEAIRSRVQAEHDRLEALARENRDIVSFIEVNAFPSPIDAQGNVEPDLALSIEAMQQSGAWESMSRSYVAELERRAADPEVPESERPTEEQIQVARQEGIIPVAF